MVKPPSPDMEITWRPGHAACDADRLRQRVRHRAVQHRAEQAPPPVEMQIARRPDRGLADVAGEHGIGGGDLVDHLGDILRMDRLAAGHADRELVEALAGIAVMRLRLGQERVAGFLGELRQQQRERAGDVADEAEIEARAAAQILGAQIDLRHLGVGRVELPIGKIRAQHQQQVAIEHGMIAGREADQSGHADVELIVVLDIFLAAQRMDDRRLDRLGQLENLIARTRAAGAAQQRDAAGAVEQPREPIDLARRRQHGRRQDRRPPGGLPALGLAQPDVAGQHDDRDAALVDGGAHGDVEHARHLRRLRDQLAEMAAFPEQDFRMGLLEVAAADLGTGDLGGDREHRHPVAMAIEQAVDEMQVAGPAAAGADGERPGHLRLGAGGEARHLLVAHMHPADAASSAAPR